MSTRDTLPSSGDTIQRRVLDLFMEAVWRALHYTVITVTGIGCFCKPSGRVEKASSSPALGENCLKDDLRF